MVLLAVAAVIVAAGFGLWYILVGPASPADVSAASPLVPAGVSVTAPASLDGTWQVNTSLGSMADFSASWAGYRVQEQLVGIGGHEAVGRTPKVSGSLTLSGSNVAAVSVTADLTALSSDNPNRDSQLRRQAIATAVYPTATFTLTQPIALVSLPGDGSTVSAHASGNLNLHGVTRPVQIEVQALRRGGIIAVTGSLPIVFADYGFSGPTAFSVLSVDNHGIMEWHLLFTHL
jgi:polyisoprenoid-binding protein YceI